MTGNIILSRNVTITKLLSSNSHYSSAVNWSVDGETKKYGREIGLHNIGGSDSTGSIAIVPYKTDIDPWSGTVGLFIAKNTLKLDGKPIALKSDIPSSLKNPYSLTLQANGTTLATYDGSVSKIVNLTYNNVGAAAKNHTHNSLEPWASRITGDSHSAALKSLFNENKTSIPRNKFISMLSSAYDNTSYYMGYFLNGYNNNPYGGFFVAHYDTAYYVGISNGSFTQHRLVYSTDIPNSLKNPHALTISLNGTSQGPYDGSAAKSINITPSSIGAATSGHNHDGRYLRLDGSDTMTGVFKAKANQYNDGYDGAINMNNSDIYGLNSIYTADRSDAQAEGIHFWRDSTHVDTLRMMDGKLLFTPNRPLGGSGTEQTVLHTGNSHIKGGTITINGSSIAPLTSLPSHSHSWDSITGKPSSFTPSSHTHSWTSITDKLVAGNEFNIVNAGFNSTLWFNYRPINDASKAATISDYDFGNGNQGYASIKASGFKKNGSSSSYVLLGDGGHKTISSLSVNYANSAGSVAWSNVTGRPSSLKNPYSLNVFGVTYDGSAAKTVTTSNFISQLEEGTSTVTDGTMFITSWASNSGFADTSAVNVPYKRKASCLWSYIDSKVSSKYLPLAGGTMNASARISHDKGNLYIGRTDNYGWVMTQDIASQSGTDNGI